MTSIPILGLDLSLQSPGIALLHPISGWHFAGFAQRKKPMFVDECYTRFPKIPSIKLAPDSERYQHIRQYLKAYLLQHIDISLLPRTTVIIEGYAFRPGRQGSSYKLHELGGVLKHMISYELNIQKVYIVAPSKWKSGIRIKSSPKSESFQYATTKNQWFKRLVGTIGSGPHPYEDIADAICLVYWFVKTHRC